MLNTILMILAVIILGAIVFAIIKSLIKATIFVVGVLIVILIILSIVVAYDVNNFKNQLETNDNSFILEHNDNFIEGYTISDNEIINLDSGNLNKLENILEDGKIEKEELTNNSTKYFIVINSEILEESKSFTDNIKDIFSNSKEIVKQVQQENIKVYPKRGVFELISKKLPKGLVNLAKSLFIRG